jgi:hypothetical protein
MQIPTSSMASTLLLGLGRFHLAALAQSPATRGLAAAFQPTQDALAAAHGAREQAEEALATPRVAARFSEFALERVIRQVALLAHTADNNTDSGPAFRGLFPDGLDAELRPRGAAQLAAAAGLRARLGGQPAAAGVKAQVAEALDAAIALLGASLEARQAAERALGIARANEDGARETFVAAYDSNAGAIRQMFPRQRAQQDLHFDDFRERRVTAAGGDGHPGGAPGAGTPGDVGAHPA